jgi:uncharacterized protein (TIGR02284 family)
MCRVGIYLLSAVGPACGAQNGEPGARGFRDFSRLPPAQENRGQPADPAHLSINTGTTKGTLRMATTTEGKNQEFESALKAIISVLEDGQKGMAEIGERLKDEELKRFFLAESLKRANFRGELENELHRHGIADVKESGTMTGSLYRAWAGMKAALGGGDRTLLETAEEADEETRQAYKDALDQNLPVPVRQLLVEQQTQILMARDFMREARTDLKKAS